MKVEAVLEFLRKQLTLNEVEITKETIKSGDLVRELFKIRTVEADIVIRKSSDSVFEIKGVGLKKFQINVLVGDIFIKVGKEAVRISDKEMFKELQRFIEDVEQLFSKAFKVEEKEVIKKRWSK